MKKETPFKYASALSDLRQLIYAQYREPGMRFLSFDELDERFDYGRTAIQRAIKQIKEDGVLEARGLKGLFTAAHSPHYTCYPLVFRSSPDDREWSVLEATAVDQAKRIEQERGIKIPVHYGVRPETKALAELKQELLAYRCGGLITVHIGDWLDKEDGVSRSDLHHVAVLSRSGDSGMTKSFGTDGDTFWDKAWSHLCGKQCKRTAIICLAESLTFVTNMTKRKGLDVPQHWIQPVDRHYPETADHIVALLMDYPEAQRPMGIIVNDDNLLDAVLAGVVKHGLKVGEDLHIVSHCNWPLISPNTLPVFRIGCDIYGMLNQSIDYLSCARRQVDYQGPSFYQSHLTQDEI